jgi:hypothetical protein
VSVDVGSFTDELRQCRDCDYWAYWLTADGRCRPCALGWVTCPTGEHGGWELAGWRVSGDTHIRVTVPDVLAATRTPEELPR